LPVRRANAGLVEELVPTVLALSEVQKVLQNLLQEKVSIRNLALILEVFAEGARQTRDAGQLTELVRQQLGATICQALLGKGNELAVLTLDPKIEQSIAASLRSVDDKATLVLEPRYAEQVLGRMGAQDEKMVKSNLMPVLVCAPQLRRHLRILTVRVLPQLSILSMAEIPPHLALRAFNMVSL
jgi:flagellar biosynthesis protein FlhA